MYKIIVTLSNFLRKEGMLVSIRSTTTASSIYSKYHEEVTTDELRELLRCIYVKNKEDDYKFNNVFDKIFIKPKPKKDNKYKYKPKYSDSSDQPFEYTGGNMKESEDEMNEILIEERQRKKVINDKLLNDSVALLDFGDRRVYDICKRLAKKIANSRSKRRKRKRSNKINMPYTIRANLKNGGHLIKLIHQKPQLRKSKQIFLCDISGSCQWISSWFFAIIHGCYETFDKVTVYVFDSKINNVTDTLSKEYTNTTQINMDLRRFGGRAYGQSDMTNSFKEILDEVDLNNHTDVIILTDCRDWNGKRENGILESAQLLHNIVVKSRKVIILNPEKQIRWKTATSCVKEYKHSGAEVYETATLNQFANVVSKL